MKVTQKQQEDFIRERLGNDKVWALRGLIKVYEYQTNDEQNSEQTLNHNGVGFTPADAGILSSLASFYISRGYLTDRQMQIVYRRIQKYAGQVRRMSNTAKLIPLVQKQLSLNL